MAKSKSPKLRKVKKSSLAFPLNKFPQQFPYELGKELIYLLATRGKPILEGGDWEHIFANCIGAQWKPSNVGLDDVVMGNTAWGAKTVKATNPSSQDKIRLISGRNSPTFSFGKKIDAGAHALAIGNNVLDIYNKRVADAQKKFKNLRTVVLIKSKDLLEVKVFEFKTVNYKKNLFKWAWNKRKNLEGFEKKTGEHRFTWQPHGSQFTIIEDVPPKCLVIKIKKPNTLDKKKALSDLGVDKSWITVIQKNG